MDNHQMKIEYPLPVSVIIPAYNEKEAIRRQIEAIQQVMASTGIQHEIIVVDDGSTDATSQEALKAGARLLQHPENRGYGASLKTGILAARYDLIVIIDADNTYPAEEIPHLISELNAADMVVGARTGKKVHIPWVRQPAKWFLRELATRIAEQPIPDLNSGMRAFWRDCARQYFPVLSNRFSFTTTITLAYLADGYRIVYHPINYYPRVGKSKIVPRHFMDFIILIIRMTVMFNPLKVFVPLAMFFGAAGVGKTLYDVWAAFARNPGSGLSILLQPVLSTSALLLLFVGLQIMMIGMMADGVIRRIAQHSRPLVPSQASVVFRPEYSVPILPKEPIEEKSN
jgi:glycosyltransferase involved in cell wall biosynthesis